MSSLGYVYWCAPPQLPQPWKLYNKKAPEHRYRDVNQHPMVREEEEEEV